MTTPRVAAALEELRAALLEELLGTISTTLGSTLGSEALAPLGVTGRKGAAAPRKSRAKGAKRTADEIAAQSKTVLAFIKKNPGSRAEQIGAGTGIGNKELPLVLKNLLADKEIGRKGQKRATSYSAK